MDKLVGVNEERKRARDQGEVNRCLLVAMGDRCLRKTRSIIFITIEKMIKIEISLVTRHRMEQGRFGVCE